MTDPAAVLRAWADDAHDVTLPTGRRVKVRLPGPDVLVRHGQMPKELRGLVLRLFTGVIDARQMSDAQLDNVLTMRLFMAADSVRAIYDEPNDAWLEVALDAETLRKLGLPGEDLTALELMAIRARTPQQITADSRARLGLANVGDALRRIDEEAGATVDGWRPFRDGPGGGPPGADGGEVREVAGAGLSRDP